MNPIVKSAVSSGMLVLIGVLSHLGTTGCNDDEEGRACTAMGCQSGATFTIPLSQTLEMIQSSTVEVCLNDACLTGLLTGITPVTGSDAGVVVTIPANAPALPRVSVGLNGTSGGYQLTVQYEAEAKDDLTDGDRYHIRVVDVNGTVVVDKEQTAAYEVLSPNGPECDPAGGLCLVMASELEAI